MHPKICVTLLAGSLATAAVAWGLPAEPVRATGGAHGATCDADEDFLPDAVEWAVLTSAANPDTDGDHIPDFVEVVERGRPRHESSPLPQDQQMRLVVTGPSLGGSDPRTWMHVFLRVMTPSNTVPGTPNGIQSFDTWLEMPGLPGLRVPLNSLAAGGVVFRERVTQTHGIWLQLSIPMVSPAVLAAVLPCTIWAESVVAGRALKSGVKLVDANGDISTLVPFGDGRFVVQTITPVPLPATTGHEPNRVCVIELEEVGSGPGGVVYEVVDAACEDANELECAVTCPDCIGWILTIAGGTELLGGD